MDPVGHGLDQGHEAGGGRGSSRFANDLREGKFARAINGNIEVALVHHLESDTRRLGNPSLKSRFSSGSV